MCNGRCCIYGALPEKGGLPGGQTTIESEKLQALRLHSKRITQLLFSDVEKGYSEHLKSDVWFDIVTYISSSNDGVRSYHEKHHWLERFIIPFDPEISSEVSEGFQGARVEFELAPAEFIGHIERFSELLKTRDLCKLLLEYLGKSTDKDKRYSKLQFWISLQVTILDIMQSARSLSTATTTHTYDSKSSDRIRQSLQQFRESSPGDSCSSAAGQLQEF
jgi:hypothetical protein